MWARTQILSARCIAGLRRGNNNASENQSLGSLKIHQLRKHRQFQDPFCYIMFIFSNK